MRFIHCRFAGRIITLFFASFAIFTAQAEQKLNSIVAIIDNQSISEVEVNRRQALIREQFSLSGRFISATELRKTAFNSLIDDAVQLQRAYNIGFKEISQDMINHHLEIVKTSQGAKDINHLRQIIEQERGMTWEEFNQELIKNIQIEGAYYRDVFSQIKIQEAEIEHFLKTETRIIGEREFHLRHLLVDYDNSTHKEARALIDKLRQRIIDGESFADLAREYSDDDSSAADGGDLKWRTITQLPSAFIAQAQDLDSGDLSSVISSNRGLHLLQLIATRGGDIESVVEQFAIAHIFLELNKTRLAKDIYQQILDGGDYKELAQRYSTDAKSVESSGIIGNFYSHELPEYFNFVQDMSVGEIHPPVASPFGIHIVKLIAKSSISQEQAREQASEALRQQRAATLRRDWLDQLRNRAYIVIIDPAYADLIDDGIAS